jgi:UDP-glucuronate decarboxylase
VEKVQKEEGNPLAKRVNIIHKEIPIDDPQRRRPDTSRAKESLKWQPKWSVRQGVSPQAASLTSRADCPRSRRWSAFTRRRCARAASRDDSI